MPPTRPADLPAVRLELDNEWAWCGTRRLDLPPRQFALLRHLVEHPQRLVTKDELFTAVWAGMVVSEAALTSSIRDLRRALADSSRTPRYIETVHRRGFRFIGPVAPASAPVASAPTLEGPPRSLVGRRDELARLHAFFATARGGRRQVVFVTGEAGIGKTTLVEAFLAQLDAGGGLRVGRGQCVEQYGTGEAYLPVLEALGRMARDGGGGTLVRTLRQYAPTWLAQLPALLTDDDLEAVQRRAHGSTRERMLRELIEAFDVLGAEAPAVLLLEDLHWSDSATIELLTMLARRRDPARLLIVGTYRPADVAAGTHPLKAAKQELQMHGHCEELALEFLTEAAVGEYLDARFAGAAFPARFPRVLHESTSGNPLFLVNVVDQLIAEGQVRESDGRWELSLAVEDVASRVPHTLAQMVEAQIERLTPGEQAMLAVASVAGAEFSAALATTDGIEAREGEQVSAALARRGRFLRALGTSEWPDGTVAGRYGFIHALYRTVLYGRVSIGHRVGLHLRIGTRLEHAYGPRAGDIAGELAMHFEHGRDFERAAHHRRQAADSALRQHAHREAVDHATRALELLAALPESTERDRQELMVQTVLGAAVIATNGWAAPQLADTYARARDLCARTGVTPQLFPVLVGLGGFYVMRGELGIAREVAAQLLALAETTEDPAIRLSAHNTMGLALFYGGEFVTARGHFERAGEIYDPERHSPSRLRAVSVDHDSGVSCAAHTALTLLMLGYPDRAATHMQECLAYARAIDHPLSLAMAYNFAATLYLFRREPAVVEELEAVRFEYATKYDFDLFLLLGEIYRGWLLLEQGRGEDGAASIRQGLAVYQAIGAELGRPTFLAILAEVEHALGRTDEALSVIGEAIELAERTGLHYWDAELQRVKGTLLLASVRKGGRAAAQREAEACFREALEIARRQQGKAFELRAAMSLGRLWRSQGKVAEAHALLSDVYAWFVEGFATPDLTEAAALLEQLGGVTRGRR